MATKRVTPVEKLTYEEAIVEMESIVEKMRTGELTLQDSVEAYKRGKELSLRCETLLKEAQQVVQKLEGGVLVDVDAEELRGKG